MLRRSAHIFACLLPLLAFTERTASAGIVMVWRKGEVESTAYIQGSKVRIEDGDAAHVGIFDNRAKVLTLVSVTDRTYSETDKDRMRAARAAVEARLAESRKELRASLERMPSDARESFLSRMSPEERAALEDGEERGGARETSEVATYERTADKGAVAGFACEWFHEVQGQKPPIDVCLIPWKRSPVSREELRPLEGLLEFCGAGVPTQLGLSHLQVRKMIAALPGLIALRKVGRDGKEWERLIRVERQNVSAEKFAPPLGYTKSTIGFLESGEIGSDATPRR